MRLCFKPLSRFNTKRTTLSALVTPHVQTKQGGFSGFFQWLYRVFLCPVGKCRGLRTARKLRDHRREQKWHDKQYKKAHLGTALKANPFGGASHAKGIVLEKV